MNKITLQLYLDGQRHNAAELIINKPYQGHLGTTRLDYMPEYVLAHLHECTVAGAATLWTLRATSLTSSRVVNRPLRPTLNN